jgi:tRNA G18 (ribose-2'-O)-methylase SpoU
MKKLSLHELNRKTPEAFKNASKLSLTLVLDNIRSMHNIGAAFRIADAFIIEKIYLCGITAHPPHREIHKTALGAEDTVTWEYVANTSILLQKLKEDNHLIIGLEQTDKSLPLDEFILTEKQKYALVVGNEIVGISNEALAKCDIVLEIPQYGTKHSLNVSVSMGIAVWEIAKKQLKNLP